MVALELISQQSRVRITALENFSNVAVLIDSTAKYSGQRLDKVEQFHTVVANGKLMLQKKVQHETDFFK